MDILPCLEASLGDFLFAFLHTKIFIIRGLTVIGKNFKGS